MAVIQPASAREILAAYGLEKVGYWELGAFGSTRHLAHLQGINFVLDTRFREAENVVYAFLIDSEPCYVGETTRGMNERFKSYRYGNTKETDRDNYVKIEITQALEQSKAAEIWASQPRALLRLGDRDLMIPASKPLEELLIGEFEGLLNKKCLTAPRSPKGKRGMADGFVPQISP